MVVRLVVYIGVSLSGQGLSRLVSVAERDPILRDRYWTVLAPVLADGPRTGHSALVLTVLRWELKEVVVMR